MQIKKTGSWAISFFLSALLIFSSAQNANGSVDKTYWRIASYPSWTGELQQYHYDAFNMFFHFNMEPQVNGGLGYGGIGNVQNAINEISKAHAQDDLMILVVGGWGYVHQFQGATNDINRAKFVSEITNRVEALGYDGVTMDWEDGVNNPNLVKTMKELRTSFNNLNPVPLLLMDACCTVTIDSIKQIEPYVDSINTMDYKTHVSGYFNKLVSAGIPVSKIINGLGFYAYVNTEARTRSEAQFVIDNGMKGIGIWDSGEVRGATDARIKTIGELLGTGPAVTSIPTASETITDYNAAGTTTLLSDLNSDSKVNSLDLGIIMSNWSDTSKSSSDINQDGIVNSADLEIATSEWKQ